MREVERVNVVLQELIVIINVSRSKMKGQGNRPVVLKYTVFDVIFSKQL